MCAMEDRPSRLRWSMINMTTSIDYVFYCNAIIKYVQGFCRWNVVWHWGCFSTPSVSTLTELLCGIYRTWIFKSIISWIIVHVVLVTPSCARGAHITSLRANVRCRNNCWYLFRGDNRRRMVPGRDRALRGPCCCLNRIEPAYTKQTH